MKNRLNHATQHGLGGINPKHTNHYFNLMTKINSDDSILRA